MAILTVEVLVVVAVALRGAGAVGFRFVKKQEKEGKMVTKTCAKLRPRASTPRQICAPTIGESRVNKRHKDSQRHLVRAVVYSTPQRME